MVPEALFCVCELGGAGFQPQQEGDSRTSEAEHMWPSVPAGPWSAETQETPGVTSGNLRESPGAGRRSEPAWDGQKQKWVSSPHPGPAQEQGSPQTSDALGTNHLSPQQVQK